MTSVHALLSRLADLRVLVLGDAVLDLWTYGSSQRLAREAPVPVLDVCQADQAPGAAANCAANAAALGCEVDYVGIVGSDDTGQRLRTALQARGVDPGLLVQDPLGATPAKHRLVCDGQVVARFDTGLPGRWSSEALEALRDRVLRHLDLADVVVAADYGNGTLTSPLIEDLGRARARLRGPLVVDGHRFARWRGCRPTAMTPSASEVLAEWGELFAADADADADADAGARPGARGRDGDGAAPDPLGAIAQRSQQLLQHSGSELLLTTFDSRGTLLVQRGRAPHRTTGLAVANAQACGAGDTLTTAFAVALAAGASPAQAADLAQEAASIVVVEPGTSCCSVRELKARLERRAHVADGSISAGELEDAVRAHRAAGRRIAFTNGCFDVLHAGHVAYLRQARALGDVLVVAVNSDASVARLKGPGRPIVPESERAALLAALRPVDHVVLFDEETPERLLELVRPDVYVKGGDYTPEMLPETAVVERLGGEVVMVDYVDGHSTTELVERIRARDDRPQHVPSSRNRPAEGSVPGDRWA
ncbi:D-glycero-beta-D-manno-heptose 1-phosphate adenylyltransferase [Pedococcus sp. 5OH_020]|uniref:D-glycero-beta-D-manno-heptose 1-phosphate adenylyltransferase n=1 Tax=Pedococcus sp. 5OH_020 TaxID=2989814 RepID=UPI0022E9FBD8|nr:D-glycero-beta-D-manno-heptose 1-phosphate adenylyltransferase [Pedococcus sp. 5OH_020]